MPRLRRSHSYRRVTIVAGEPEYHCWCATCGTPTRLRIPLHAGTTAGPVVNVLEVCPGCGTGHDRPSVTITRAPRERQRRGHPLARLARALHGRMCARKGLRPLGCAHGDCRWPGLYRHEHAIEGEDGTWRYLFCRKSHQRAWAMGNGIIPS